MKPIESLVLWADPVARPGPEAMAADEWLLELSVVPVLRVYGWQGDWGSIGYFGDLAEARAAFPGLEWVRRWTGGGTVDHRADWTYSLIVPKGGRLAGLRGAESYRRIHEALVACLSDEAIHATLSGGAEATGSMACFENPVDHDLVDGSGAKLAGAGQRRTRNGLLHQGSVAAPCGAEVSIERARRLASHLSDHWEAVDLVPPPVLLDAKVRARYADAAWTRRR